VGSHTRWMTSRLPLASGTLGKQPLLGRKCIRWARACIECVDLSPLGLIGLKSKQLPFF